MKKILFFLLLLFPTNAFAINFKMSCSGNWIPTEFFDEKYIITDTNIIRSFLDNNHVQGYTHASTSLGLYHNNELISIMTFGKNRFKKNSNELEMVRFCNKLNTTIIGGASKLFKHFVNNYNDSGLDIISFADRRFFDGKLY